MVVFKGLETINYSDYGYLYHLTFMFNGDQSPIVGTYPSEPDETLKLN